MDKGSAAAILLFSYPLGVSDVITHTARRLAERGLEVDIFVDEASLESSPYIFSDRRVHLQEVSLNPSLKTEHPCPPWPALNDFLGKETSFPRFPLYLSQVERLARRPYRLLIGVEPFGLIAARLLQLDLRAPLLYYNMELFQRSNCKSPDMLTLKELEIEASGECSFTLIQDEARAGVFAKENGIARDRILILPVSTSGPAVTRKSDYFRDLFRVPPERKIILYAGHITDWAMCREIVEAAGTWPKDWVLVLHSWKANVSEEDYFRELVGAAGRNCFFSTSPIPPELFPEALSSADVGLMFYRPIDENFTETGSSSNKLAHYLQAGLPVVGSAFPSISRIFDRYGCGLTVSHPRDAAAAIAAIMARYDSFREGSHRAFQDHFDFDRAFSTIQERIDLLYQHGAY